MIFPIEERFIFSQQWKTQSFLMLVVLILDMDNIQCMKVKSESEVAQSCLTLRNPMDCSLPGSSVHRIFQARVLELGAIAFSEYR